jgi:hypothetical protein
MLGEPAEVVTASGARYAMVAPSGAKKPLFGAGAARIALTEAGEWKLLADGEVVDALAVLPLDARESDLSGRGPYEVHASSGAGLVEFGAERPRPRWMLALLLLLLLVDFWVTARAGQGQGGGATQGSLSLTRESVLLSSASPKGEGR